MNIKLLGRLLAALCCAGVVSTATAGNVTWNKGSVNGNNTYNLMDAANWDGGYPANGSNVFMVWTRTTSGPATKTLTNATTDNFFANSLSITNASSRDDVYIYFKGGAYFTNGIGQFTFAGAANSKLISVVFSNTLQFKTLNFTGSGGSGDATLTLAGTSTGGDLIFNGGSGYNFLIVSGPLNLSGALIATNINSNSRGTLSGNATMAQLIVSNAANNLFVITNSTTTITGSVVSAVSGLTLAQNATIAVTGTGGLILNNIALQGGYITGTPLTNAGQTTGYGTISNAIANTPSTAQLTATNGELTLVGSVSGPGTFRAVSGGAGGTLTFAGGGSITTLANPAANIKISGAAILTNVNPFANAGTLIFADGNYFSSANVSNLSGSLITGQGTLNAPLINLGTVEATNGTLVVAQNPTLSGGTVNVRQGGTLQFGAGPLLTVTNLVGGMVNLYGGSLVQAGLVNNGQIVNQSGSGLISNGLVNAAGAFLKITSGNLKIVPELQNFGVVSNSATLTIGSTGTAPFRNAGVLALNNGTVVAGVVTNESAGLITGTGTLAAALVHSSGTIEPGLGGAGTLAMSDLTLTGSSTVRLDLLATNSYDRIVLSGQLAAGGTLVVTNLTGFTLANGDTFDLFDFGSQSGSFALTLPDLDPGLSWNTAFLNSDGTIAVIPEPSALSLVGVGLVLMLLVNRRRSRA